MTPARNPRPRAILRIHFHPVERNDELYGHLLTVLDGVSPRIEPLPADWSAYVDLTGALTFWDRDVEGLIAVLRLRLLALHGVQSSAGAGPTRGIAAMAADATPPGAATVVVDDPYEIAAFLRPKPAAAPARHRPQDGPLPRPLRHHHRRRHRRHPAPHAPANPRHRTGQASPRLRPRPRRAPRRPGRRPQDHERRTPVRRRRARP
nr:hypothetical protein [Streptomyces sp. F8]AHE39831.1 DNA-directed DNA polymerase [Streptomyces sp. F8]